MFSEREVQQAVADLKAQQQQLSTHINQTIHNLFISASKVCQENVIQMSAWNSRLTGCCIFEFQKDGEKLQHKINYTDIEFMSQEELEQQLKHQIDSLLKISAGGSE